MWRGKGSYCGVENNADVCFTTAYTGEKKRKNQIKKTSGHGTAGISESESGYQLSYA